MKVEIKENIYKEIQSVCIGWLRKLRKIYVKKYKGYVQHGSGNYGKCM